MDVLRQLGVATLMVSLTVLIHFIGLSVLLAVVSRYRPGLNQARNVVGNAIAILGAAFGLFALHGLEIWVYALLYWGMAAFGTFEAALYFSTVTYSTIGYGDLLLPQASRLIGAIEGANGIILLGWSTAFFFAVVDRMKLLERELEDGA
jgi:voltage-gated potassium channel